MMKSINIEQLCLRLNAAYQYQDPHMGNERLFSIEKNAPFTGEIDKPLTYARLEDSGRRNCDIYTILSKDRSRPMREKEEDSSKISTVKNFLKLSLATSSFKQKEAIYWGLRLRCAGDVVPVAVMNMVPYLVKKGYTGWELPNGETVKFGNVWLARYPVRPTTATAVRILKFIDNVKVVDLMAMEDRMAKLMPDTQHYVNKSVLVVKSASGKRFILDPTSLEFGYRPNKSKLIAFQEFDEYVAQLPGTIMPHAWVGLEKFDSSALERAYRNGNHNGELDTVDNLVKTGLKNLNRPCCNYCGETEKDERPKVMKIKLSSCKGCDSVKYCDKLCQKEDWKNHKSVCGIAKKK